MRKSVDLNADMGESFGPWTMGDDAALLDIISSANIACGFHAGDPDVMAVTAPDKGVDCSAGCEAVCFDTYRDHRMAMALSLIALRRPNVTINDPGCVDKTYPGFFGEFARLYD